MQECHVDGTMTVACPLCGESARLPFADDIECLAERIHVVYQAEAKRQDDVRHVDSYHHLPERVKMYDRAIARFILRGWRPIPEEEE